MQRYVFFCNKCGKFTKIECDCSALNLIRVFTDIDVKAHLSFSIKCPECDNQTNLVIIDSYLKSAIESLYKKGYLVTNTDYRMIQFMSTKKIPKKVCDYFNKENFELAYKKHGIFDKSEKEYTISSNSTSLEYDSKSFKTLSEIIDKEMPENVKREQERS